MKQKLVNGRWMIWTPDSVADWDGGTGDPVARHGWEFERFESYRRHLRWDDVFFDVGAEHGWISAILAREFVDPTRMHLFEPTDAMWSNLRLTWEYNGLPTPAGMIHAFAADHSDLMVELTPHDMWSKWPVDVEYGVERAGVEYRSLRRPGLVHSVTLDDYSAVTGAIPDAISIDVEGAEMIVLRGAAGLLRAQAVRNLWVSVHPDLLDENYGSTVTELLGFMAGCGYAHEMLGLDHEEHHRFYLPLEVRS